MKKAPAMVMMCMLCGLAILSGPMIVADPDTEPNDDFNTAMPITPGVQWGYVKSSDRTDFFTFNMSAEKRWLLNVTNKGGDDVNITIYGHDRNQLFASNYVSFSESLVADYIHGHITSPSARAYYINVSWIPGGVYTACNYTVNLTVFDQADGWTAGQGDAEDIIDDPMDAPFDVALKGAVGDLDPADYYAVNGTSGGTINVYMTVVSNPPFPDPQPNDYGYVTLYNTNKQQVARSPGTPLGGGNSVSYVLAPNDTRIFIEVDSNNGTGGGIDYRMNISHTPGTVNDTPPVVDIRVPLDGSTVANPFWVNGTASDDFGLTRIEFSYDRMPYDGTFTAIPAYTISPVSSNPRDFQVPFTLEPGTYNIRAMAYDTHSPAQSGYDVAYNVTVVNGTGNDTAPVVDIRVPIDGSTVINPFWVNGTASDDLGLTRIEFSYDKTPYDGSYTAIPAYTISPVSANPKDFSVPFTLDPGTYNIRAMAYDTHSPEQSGYDVAYNVTVVNGTGNDSAPVVDIRVPIDGSTVINPFWVNGTASDDFGLTRIEFSYDTKPYDGTYTGIPAYTISPVSSNPREFMVPFTLDPGTYNIRAMAYDTHSPAQSGYHVAYNVTVVNGTVNDTAPKINITFPADGARTTRLTTKVTGTAWDDVRVSEVKVISVVASDQILQRLRQSPVLPPLSVILGQAWLDAEDTSTGAAPDFSTWQRNSTTLKVGKNLVIAYAKDSSGKYAYDWITVQVTKPVVKPKPFIPGFEGPVLVCALLAVPLLLGMKKRRT